jgi:serine/threonine protein kinase
MRREWDAAQRIFLQLSDSMSHALAVATATSETLLSSFDSPKARFDIIKQLGSGTFASVWQAYDMKLNKEIALKKVSYCSKKGVDFERSYAEYDLVKHLRHPNIVGHLDCLATDTDLFLVQELAPCGEFFDLVVPDVGASLNVARKVLKHLTCALAYLDEMGIVHRDIKPENIVIGSDGNAKLCDFGLSPNHDVILC